MSIVGISICSKLGSPILSRNFSRITHSRLELLLSHFIQSLSSNQQHSYVETEEALFVFQPLNQLYLVLITTKYTNVFQYIECLHLAGRLIASLCDSLADQEIFSRSADILLAFDEIIASGNFDNITLPQINSSLSMHSHEEELQELIEKNKIQEARQIGKLKMKQLELERKEGSVNSILESKVLVSSKSREEVATEKIDLTSKSRPIRSGKGLNLKKY